MNSPEKVNADKLKKKAKMYYKQINYIIVVFVLRSGENTFTLIVTPFARSNRLNNIQRINLSS